MRAGPWGGLSAFGQLSAGNRGIRYLARDTVELKNFAGIGGSGFEVSDSVETIAFHTLDSSAKGFRAGAEFNRGLFHLGAAMVHHDVDETAPYGFGYDRFGELHPGLAINGVEAYASVPLIWRELTLQGWYQRWFDAPDRVYLPTQLGRAAVQFNGVYKGGNLEPTLRVEMLARDATLAGDPAVLEDDAIVNRYAVFNIYLQIRIIDIRLFYRYDNLFNLRNRPYDVPGTLIPTGRALYGVRWFFRN